MTRLVHKCRFAVMCAACHAMSAARKARIWRHMGRLALCAALPVFWAAGAHAQLDPERPAPAAEQSEIALFCENTVDVVAEQRNEWQIRSLLVLRDEVDVRINQLRELRIDLEQWIERRDAILDQVEEHVVTIYSRMRPESAAEQIAILDIPTAVGILAKLSSRQASAILNEMDTGRAAELTQRLTQLADGSIGSTNRAEL